MIVWHRNENKGLFEFIWRERGGPQVHYPTKSGFGSQMIERVLASYFGGSSVLNFEPEGFEFKMSAPLNRIQI
ncbi:hypothetical protein A9995_00005 [Erythrobacter sp. QSSC1-22B]|nr:hypothetical protein A9995_00005 [Erythrobacter sp. QSSC1-22B]